jgi:hypothetical protein
MRTDTTSDRQFNANEQPPEPSSWDVREVRIRLPRRIIHELKRVAEANGMTMNGLVSTYINVGLKAAGRPSIDDLAPWFDLYLRRKGGPVSLDSRPAGNGEDFT